MKDFTKEHLIILHDMVLKFFPITRGIKDKGLLDSIAERPKQQYYNKIFYRDVYHQCASIMEGVIRWHPFIDGNKRTALIAAYTYMALNGYFMVVPFSAVRFSVLIAKDDTINLDDIARWLKKLTARNRLIYHWKIWRYTLLPILGLLFLALILPSKARKILDEWLAIDIYPEYSGEVQNTTKFLIKTFSNSDTILSKITNA